MVSKAFVIIATANVQGPKQSEDINCANADLPSAEYIEQKTMVIS